VDSVLQNVTDAAVWGSLLASAALGAFIFVQALIDPPRRWRFSVFGLACWIIVALDFLHGELGKRTYEYLRVFAWSFYGTSLLLLFGFPSRLVLASAVLLPLPGMALWYAADWTLATSAAVPLAFAVAAVAHGRQYWQHRGFSSGLLCSYSTATSMLCSFYVPIVSSGSAQAGLGYAHYALLSVVAVLLGWVNLPREMRGFAPVRVARRHAVVLFAGVVGAEAAVVLSLLAFHSWPPVLYLVASLFILVATTVFYFHHRHQLVIYTENVTGLLEERTASLRRAQEELARQNEVMAEKLLEQAGELQAKAEVIDRQRRLELAAQTAGQAAHDIQNLISPIFVHISRLQKEAGENLVVGQAVRSIRSQVEHLLELNGQLLALSRRGRRESLPVYLNDLLLELKDRFPGQDLVVEPAGATWVAGSWSQLTRAVSNLVTNALEACGGRAPVVARCGTLQVREQHRCHLGFLSPGRYAFIDVEDRGPGVPTEILDRIFEPYFSYKNGKQKSGSGLGLTIVAAVADDHRGVLDLRTGPGGTCFTIFIPSIDPPGGETDPAKLTGSETILVVDDDASVLQQVSNLLEGAGYAVLAADGGVQAIHLLQAEQVDLILLDLKMPSMTGLETFFGAIHMRPGVRAIVHSSYVTGDEARRLEELGVAALLQKPAGRVEILKTVRQVLDARGARLPAPGP
jgi:signal transduction histidine kinase/ActR/RegA family two-component response regulator